MLTILSIIVLFLGVCLLCGGVCLVFNPPHHLGWWITGCIIITIALILCHGALERIFG